MRVEGDEPTVIVDGTVPACTGGDRDSTVLFADAERSAATRESAGSGGPAASDARSEVTLPTRPGEATPVPAADFQSGQSPGMGHAGAAVQAGMPAPPSGSGSIRYVVIGLAGRGGMGTVHVARDVDLLRRVALKELTPGAALSADARARFIREVQVTAQLDHPHVVPVYGLEVAPGDRPAYAMKLVEGRTFADLVAEIRDVTGSGASPGEQLGLPARLEHFLKVCDAIAYAHDRGVIHRDLKPANLMVGPHNEVYVMDWGLCRVGSASAPESAVATGPLEADAAAAGGATIDGTVAGTPRYMSPEQARGRTEHLDAQSDQYSLGLILQELVTLRPAIDGTGLTDLIQRAAEGRRAPVRPESGAPIPAELVAIIDRATAVDPDRRYPSVSALAADLRRFLRGDAVEARPDSAWQKALRSLARHRQAAGIAVLLFATVCLAVIAALLWRHDRALSDQQFRERRLQALVNDVADQGDLLQTRLLLLQSSIVGLASALEEAAEHGEPSPARAPWFGDPVVPAAADGAGVFVPLAHGGRTAGIEAGARRVQPAAVRARRWLAEASRLLGDVSEAPAPAREPSRSPVTRISAVFDAGFAFVAPVPGAAPSDPRADPWFSRCRAPAGAAVTTIARAGDGGSIVVCTALRTDAGDPIGALAVTVSAGDLLARLVDQWPIRSLWAALLVDEDRNVLAVHPDAAVRPSGEARALLAHEGFVSALAARDVGFFETDQPDGTAVLAFDRIHPFEWSLVVAVPARAVFDRE